MSFKKFVTENLVNEAKDPPMLLQLRRQGIRNFPNGERVALFTNPQLGIQIAVPYDSVTGTLKPSNMLPIKEDDEGNESREEMAKCLTDFYKSLIVPNPTELQTSLCNWLKSEIDEHGDFDDMPIDVLKDVHDDYCALTKGTSLEEEMSPFLWNKYHSDAVEAAVAHHKNGKLSREMAKQHIKSHGISDEEAEKKLSEDFLDERTAVRKLNNYADWYEQMERKGEVQFKLHDNGNKTSAQMNGKHLGTFHHDKKHGEIHEEVLEESPIHRINTILRTGQEDHVVFHNGAGAKVHPNTARAVHTLYHRVNSHNRAKLSQLINSSPEGLVKVAKFADELTKKNSKEA